MQQEFANNPPRQALSGASGAGDPSAPANRIRYIEHAGKRILLADFRGCTPEQMQECVRLVPEHVTRQPERSVLLLGDFSGVEFTRESIEKLKIAAAFDQPHVTKGAWVLSGNLPRVLMESIRTFSARQIEVFSTREEALAYLVA